MEITVKVVDYEDAEQSQALLDVLNAYSSDPMGQGEPLDEYTVANLIDELLEMPTAVSILAYADGKPAGLANCFLGVSTFKATRLMNIHDLAVLPEFRGNGIGNILLEAVQQKSEQMGCGKITLEVRDDNRARSLYKRFGFKSGEPEMLFWSKELG